VRVLIVDDEPWAVGALFTGCVNSRMLEIVGECGDGVSAVERILERSPDVAFLDIHMPGMDGFEVLHSLPKERLARLSFRARLRRHHPGHAVIDHKLSVVLAGMLDKAPGEVGKSVLLVGERIDA
jgi:CheY-like chemotaxis protein